jgi:outer membrane receptor protein involved in Fe transport
MLVGCVSLMALSGAVWAQDAGAADTGNSSSEGAGSIETVVVTAAKTGAQSVIATPMSVQVLSGQELKEKHISDIHDLITTAVPGASEEEQIGVFVRDYALRGSGAGGGIGDPMIGYYIDDTAWSIPNSQMAPSLRMIDIDRVEVLRGPYGTLYGQGAMGGIMIFHTRDPNLDHMTVDADVSFAGMQNAGGLNNTTEGAISIPLVEGSLALRVSGGYDYQAGYASVYSGDATGTPVARHANDVKQEDFRAVLLWRPSDRFSGRFTYWSFGGYQHYSTQLQSVRPAALTNWGDIKGFEYSHSDLYSATLKYDFDWATLTSATSYIRTGGEDLYALYPTIALDQGGATKGLPYRPGTYNAQEELRLASASGGPLHWVAGMFYQNARSNYWFKIDAFGYNTQTTINTRNWSTYGEVSYDLFGGKLVPLVGVRYFSDSRSFSSNNNPGNPNATIVTGSTRPSVTTWRANLSYHPSDDMTVYFNAATGFRSPIMQSAVQVTALQGVGINGQLALKPDSDISYELGLKGRLEQFDMDYSTSIYWLAYKNFQTGVQTPTVAAFANLGTARTEGADLQINWHPIEGLTLGFTGNINRSVYGKVDASVAAASGGTFIARPGGQMLNTPGYSARFDAGYVKDIGNGYTFHTNVAAVPMAKRINQYGVYSSAFTLYDAAIGVSIGKYDFELFGENLSDERGPYYIRALTSPKDMMVGPNPRTIGLRASLNMD